MRPWWRLHSRAKAPRRNGGARPQVEFLENRLLPNSLFGPWGGPLGGLDLALNFGGGDQRPLESRADQDPFGPDDADWVRKVLSRDGQAELPAGTGNDSGVGASFTAVTFFSPNGRSDAHDGAAPASPVPDGNVPFGGITDNVARSNALLTSASVSASLAHLFAPSTGIAGSSSHAAANPSGFSNGLVAGSATLPGSLALGGGAAPAAPSGLSPQTGGRGGALAGPGVTDPYTLYTFGDSYTGSGGLDRQSFLAQYHPDNSLLVNRNAPLDPTSPPPGSGASSADPGLPGPLATTNQDYNFGLTAFTAPGAPGESTPITNIELVGRITAPADLTGGPRPVVVLLHGRHGDTYDPVSGAAFLAWPPTGNRLSITSYLGYQYLADNLASHGYVVLSLSANGVNAQDNGRFDLGAIARAQLVQRHLDILRDLNLTGTVTGLPGGPQTPFGTRYVGKIDLQNVGTMGHSRGGEGVVRHFLLNQSLGSPYGIKAVFDVAPVDFNRRVPSDVPYAVLLSYNDGDVSDLQGAHFYDDARYNDLNDPAPKYTIEVQGANHNFYNTVWSPGLFPFLGAPPGFGGTSDEGVGAPPARLTEAQEQAVGLAYMSAFFRTYVGNATVPATNAFAAILRGDAAPPPSSQVTANQVSIGYQAGANARRDVNRLLNVGNLTVNTLGGAVTTGGLTTYEVYGGDPPEARFRLPGEPSAHFPHTIPSARSNRTGLSMLHLNYQNTFNAFYQNDVPLNRADVSAFYDVQFRVTNDFTDPRNKPGDPEDFSVTLSDREGDSFTTQVSTWSHDLFFPLGSTFATPHDLLNTVRIPLAAFTGVDLTNVASVRFNFDQRAQGGYLIDDLAFADPADTYAGPFVTSTTPGPNGRILPGITDLQVAFNTAIDPSSFGPDQVTLLGPGGVTIPVTGVTPVDGTSNSHFDLSFDPLGTTGTYTLVIGPHVRDVFGNEMDQNFNGITGETPDDQYVLQFGVSGLRVVSSTPSGDTAGSPVSSLRVTFNEPANPDTFTPSQIASFAGPGGPISVLSVTPVDGSGNTQFDVGFAPQTALGTYAMVIGPHVQDAFGNEMDQNDNLVSGETPGDQYVANFKIVPRYVAEAGTFENNLLQLGQPGVVAMPFLGPSDTGDPFYADENFGIINLGANTFNFFGTTYTGNNQLFVDSEGMINFGGTESPNDFANGDLTSFPPEPTIAALWTDYIKLPSDPGGPEVLYKFDGNRLIIEWNQTKIFPSTPRGVTFQAILSLNTGATAGDVTYNYLDLNNGSFDTRLVTTAGIKDGGTQTGDGRVLVSFNQPNPLIGSGKAIRIHQV